MQGVLRAARLIDGEVVKVTWDGMRFTLHPDASPPDGLQQAMFQQELNVNIGGATIRLGWVLVTTGPVGLANVRADDTGAVTAGLIPALGNNTAHLRWLGADSASLR